MHAVPMTPHARCLARELGAQGVLFDEVKKTRVENLVTLSL
jgi:predicted SpoU family rRNA methylase